MQYGVRSLILKTLPVASSMALCCLIPIKSATAQITPDGTLGTERSVVIPNVNINGLQSDRLDGGARRGVNLFHSFGDFNVGAGRGVYFANPAGIENILSRVTGSNASNIQGTLGVLGNANLFLLNPNGIVFGPNARLDVRGSFLATTASSLVFGNGLEFSAINPHAPPLLTVNIPIGLRFRDHPGSIVNQSVAGLQVQPGNTLALVGGNVTLDGGNLSAPGGRVELGGVSQAGTVGLNSDGSLSFPQGVQRADVSLTGGASVDVSAGGGGNIAVNARNINVLTGSVLLAGIGTGLGSVGAVAGDLKLNATGETKVVGSSYVVNYVQSGAVGKGGNINITTGSLLVTNGAQLAALTRGKGDAGSVKISARDTVTFDGVGSNGNSSAAYSFVETGAVGKGGDLNITTGSLFVTNGARLQTWTRGQGDAGSVNIYARDRVTFDGVGSNGFSSGALSAVETGAVGKGGGINITTGSLSVTGGAILSTLTSGQGDAGSVKISARDTVTFDGARIFPYTISTLNGVSNNRINSSAFTGATEAGGKAGDIKIFARSLFLSNGADLNTSVLGGQANSGNILVNVTDSISVNSGAFITTSGTSASGGPANSGNILVNATDSISLNSAYITTVNLGQGKSGNIDIHSRSLSATNGAELNSATFGGGAGNITILASDTVSFDGVSSGVYSTAVSGAVGSAGSIRIAARSLSLTNSAGLNSTSRGSSAAGSIEVTTAKDILLDNGAFIASNTSGDQGNITLRSRDLFLRHNSKITTNAVGSATGGNITINTDNLVAVPLENSDISANAEESFGGRISITAAGIFGTKFRPQLTPLSDITATSNLGPQFSGTVQLNILSPDPSRGLAELPHNVVDPASQIAQNPCTRGKSSEFTVIGRGGLPPNPNEALNSDAVGVGLVEPRGVGAGNADNFEGKQITSNQSPLSWGESLSSPNSTPPNPPLPRGGERIQNPVVPAQGWVFNEKGQVVLTAYNPAVAQPQRPWQNPGACHAL